MESIMCYFYNLLVKDIKGTFSIATYERENSWMIHKGMEFTLTSFCFAPHPVLRVGRQSEQHGQSFLLRRLQPALQASVRQDPVRTESVPL